MNILKQAVPGIFLVGMLVALLSAGGTAGHAAAVPDNPFVIFLEGDYGPVVHGPNLGLSGVDLNDGTYSQVSIFSVSGIPGTKKTDKPVGTFYVQFAPDPETGLQFCSYHIPGGSFTALFKTVDLVPEPDGGEEGGINLVGTAELDILDGTGIYKSFVGGHIHMDDVLHMSAAGLFTEHCFCHVSH